MGSGLIICAGLLFGIVATGADADGVYGALAPVHHAALRMSKRGTSAVGVIPHFMHAQQDVNRASLAQSNHALTVQKTCSDPQSSGKVLAPYKDGCMLPHQDLVGRAHSPGKALSAPKACQSSRLKTTIVQAKSLLTGTNTLGRARRSQSSASGDARGHHLQRSCEQPVILKRRR